MIPTEVRELLHDRAEQVHLHGDFAPAAIRGARRVRTRRAAAAGALVVLAVAIPFGLAVRDSGPNRGNPALTSSVDGTRTALTRPKLLTAIARVGAPAGRMPLPYVQSGLLHFNGKTVRVPVREDDRLRVFATLSNGGVVYQVAGPNPAAPDFDAGPVTFLDRDGTVVAKHELTQTDTDGPGGFASGVDQTGSYIVLDATGTIIRHLEAGSTSAPMRTVAGLGSDLVANLSGSSLLWVGSLASGRSSIVGQTTIGVGNLRPTLALHEGRSLVVQGSWPREGGTIDCKMLVNYLTGEQLRSWCNHRYPLGFSPDGAWMYGRYDNGSNVWVERTDDGAPLLEIRTDERASEKLTVKFASPTPDGTALIVAIAAQDGRTVPVSCTIGTGDCRVLSDGLDAPDHGWLTLPDNWGRSPAAPYRHS